jgi:hypothetical protein
MLDDDSGDDSATWINLNDDKNFNNTEGSVLIRLADDNDDRLRADTGDIGISDGQKKRIVLNVVDSSNNNMELWVNSSEQTLDFDAQESPSAWSDLLQWYTLARYRNNPSDNYMSGHIDDHILYGDSLSPNEIEADYNNQPWS